MNFKINDIITFSRISFTPLFLYCFYTEFNYFKKVGVFFFALLCFTDFLDGYIARKKKTESEIGKIFDPIADKILSLTALILLVDLKQIKTQEIWIIYIILFREIITMGIRAYHNKSILQSSKTSKIKTLILNFAIFCLLLNISLNQANNNLRLIGLIALFISTMLSIISFVNYIKIFIKELKND